MEINNSFIQEIVKESNTINSKSWKFHVQQTPGLGERIEKSLFTNDSCNYTGIRYDSPIGDLSVWVGYWGEHNYCVSFCGSNDSILRDIVIKEFKKHKEIYSYFDKHNWYTISLSMKNDFTKSKKDDKVSSEELLSHKDIIKIFKIITEIIKQFNKKTKKHKQILTEKKVQIMRKIINSILLLLPLLFLGTFGWIKTFNNPESLVKQTEFFAKNCYKNQDECKQIPLKSISKTLNRNSDTFNIVFIICITLIIITTIICFTIFFIRQHNICLKQEKLQKLTDSIDTIEIDDSNDQKEHSTKNENGFNSKEEAFYPPNKAKVDLFKAYSNAITEL